MLVVSFSAEGAGNCVVVDGVAYVYARTARGAFLIPAQCPHRGGPLHLASVESGGARLVCPWHGRAQPLPSQAAAGVAFVRSGELVTAVFARAADTPWTREHRALSRDLTCVAPPRAARSPFDPRTDNPCASREAAGARAKEPR